MRIVKYPHPMLTHKSKPLRKIDGFVRDAVAEMFELMYNNSGVGLAANQVDLPYQLIVVNPTGNREEKDKEFVFINPVILKLKGNEEGEEGCLSYPNLRVIVPRAREVKFQAVGLDGKAVTYYWKGFDARIIQHEMDHLSGKSFYMRAVASSVDIDLALSKMKMEFEKDRAAGLEPSEEEFLENVARLESERA